MPVPIDRDDAAYFAPLRDLRTPPSTCVYLGLVHAQDGTEGASRRIESAAGMLPWFGIATECGLGRRAPETLPGLLELHARVARLPT
jgi:hypothetical protein